MKNRLGFVFFALSVACARAQGIDTSAHRQLFVPVEKDIKLEVLDWGGRGRPMVFLAGLGASAHVFDSFAPKFTAGHHVYAISRRGSGASSAPDPAHASYAADRLGDDVAAVIKALNLNRPILVGHSIAGGELSAMANRHPALVSGLVYLDAGYAYAFYAPGGAVPFGMNLTLDSKDIAANLHANLAPSAANIAKFQALLGNLQSDVAAARQYLGAMSPVPAAPGAALTAAQRRGEAIADAITAGAEKFTAIPVPALAFFATDPRSPAELAAAQARQIDAFAAGVPSARVVRLPGAAHRVWESDEATVIGEMNAFMATLN